MTLDEFNKYLEENKDVAAKFNAALKEALKGTKGQQEYPAIMVKVASEFGLELSEEEIAQKAKSGDFQKLTDEELDNVAGGFLLFFPWWS